MHIPRDSLAGMVLESLSALRQETDEAILAGRPGDGGYLPSVARRLALMEAEQTVADAYRRWQKGEE